MDYEIIKTVLAVARFKSFSAAAFAIPCAQSSVSRRVDAAESELGVKIFMRPAAGGRRAVEVTPAGERIIRDMLKIADAYSEMYFSARNSAADATTLNIGMRSNMMTPMGVSLMKTDFFEENPDMCISVRTDGFNTLLSELQMRRLDAVLFYCAELDREIFHPGKDMALLLLGNTSFSIGVSDHSPLSRRTSVKMEELSNETFLLGGDSGDAVDGIIFPNAQRLRSVSAAVLTAEKIIPRDMLEIRYRLAIEGRGVFPSHTPVPWRNMDGVTYVSVEDADLAAKYYLLYIKGRHERQVRSFGRFFANRLTK